MQLTFKDYRNLPETVEELIAEITDIFGKHGGRVTRLEIRAGEPIRYEYVAPKGEQARGDPRPYDILRQGIIEEYPTTEGREPPVVVFYLLQVLCRLGAPPVCALARDISLWDWLSWEPGLLAGYPVYYDERIPASTLVIAGARNPDLGVGGLTLGIKYVWGP